MNAKFASPESQTRKTSLPSLESSLLFQRERAVRRSTPTRFKRENKNWVNHDSLELEDVELLVLMRRRSSTLAAADDDAGWLGVEDGEGEAVEERETSGWPR